MGITTFGNCKNTRLRLVSFTLSESLATSRVHGSRYVALTEEEYLLLSSADKFSAQQKV